MRSLIRHEFSLSSILVVTPLISTANSNIHAPSIYLYSIDFSVIPLLVYSYVVVFFLLLH